MLTSIGAMLGRCGLPVVAAVAALLIAGCGSGEDTPVPDSQSEALLAQLDDIQQAVDDGHCNIAAGQAESFAEQVQALSDVDADVKDTLQQAASRLVDLANDPGQCVETGATGAGGVQPTESDTTAEQTTTTESTTATETTATDTTQAGGGGSGQQNAPSGGNNLQVGEGAGGSSGSISPGTGGVSGGGGN